MRAYLKTRELLLNLDGGHRHHQRPGSQRSLSSPILMTSWLGCSWLRGKKINLPRIEIFVFPISTGWCLKKAVRRWWWRTRTNNLPSVDCAYISQD
ncbi:hypothetical protein K443DRAFT_258000 [Laccaria amethystina LaAM-08-1]|uniref:Uncharacterized protein n=1 Tax=Laccaria amethystina LaAM-08-1 TaxID=1095629 RepID=A0A0C9X732_9AGAR|nr:hypothetical protein K443DRAFT_258000 [Laccaria amethystina LaAM-08-1]